MKRPSLPDRAALLSRLQELDRSCDPEAAHSMADDILCDLLRSLGYGDIVDAFNQIEKWYA